MALDLKELGKKIREARLESGMTLEEVAKLVDVNRSTVQRYESGKIEHPKTAVIAEIARALGRDPAFLLGGQNRAPEPPRSIPILGSIAAGLPLFAEQRAEGFILCDRSDGEYFALRVRGDSMNAACIFEGNILTVRRQSWVQNGDIAVVLVGDEEATVKKFYREGDRVTLIPQSTNPDHRVQVYDLSVTPVSVLGKVVENRISFE